MARPCETLAHRLETADQAWRWVYVRLQTTVEIGERHQSLEVWQWLPEHLELRLGATLLLPESGKVRWMVLEMGVPYRHGRPTGDYVGQRMPQALQGVEPRPPTLPPPVEQVPVPAIRLSQEPERRIAWRKAISEALQRRKAAGLPIGRQIQREKRLQAQLGAGTPPVLPPA